MVGDGDQVEVGATQVEVGVCEDVVEAGYVKDQPPCENLMIESHGIIALKPPGDR